MTLQYPLRNLNTNGQTPVNLPHKSEGHFFYQQHEYYISSIKNWAKKSERTRGRFSHTFLGIVVVFSIALNTENSISFGDLLVQVHAKDFIS